MRTHSKKFFHVTTGPRSWGWRDRFDRGSCRAHWLCRGGSAVQARSRTSTCRRLLRTLRRFRSRLVPATSGWVATIAGRVAAMSGIADTGHFRHPGFARGTPDTGTVTIADTTGCPVTGASSFIMKAPFKLGWQGN